MNNLMVTPLIHSLERENATLNRMNLVLERQKEKNNEKRALYESINDYEDSLNQAKREERKNIAITTVIGAATTSLTIIPEVVYKPIPVSLISVTLTTAAFIISKIAFQSLTKASMQYVMKQNFRFYSEELLMEIFGARKKKKPHDRIFKKRDIKKAKKELKMSDLIRRDHSIEFDIVVNNIFMEHNREQIDQLKLENNTDDVHSNYDYSFLSPQIEEAKQTNKDNLAKKKTLSPNSGH